MFFADIKSSLELLLAGRDPEDARTLLDPVLELMMQAVHQYEGTVNQVMGDGIMALFGAPVAHEDHALRACCAALRIQEEVNARGDQFLKLHGVPVQIRIGINSGEVVVRSIGSDLDMDYTAVGQTTHLAGRLEQIARPGTILCGPQTLRHAEGFVRHRSLGTIPVRGLPEPVHVAEVTGIEAARLRFHAAVARGLSPLIGRQGEYAAIVEALQSAAAGNGQFIMVVGDPGVGKSRLCWEIGRSPVVRDWLRLEMGAFSYSAHVTYGPLALLLREYCGVDDRDDPRVAREKVVTRLTHVADAAHWMLPAVLSLLGLPTNDPDWAALDAPRRRDLTTQSIVSWLLCEAEEQPVLVVVEDLHWIDQGTEAVLSALRERIAGARIVVLANARPEYRNEWRTGERVTVHRLAPLRPPNAEELLAHLIGADSALRPLTKVLVERTGGNPLFLEETVHSLVETGALAGQRGAYQLTRSMNRIDVPQSVLAILAARIDRLDPDDKRVLQAAAVVGDEIPSSLLHAIVAAASEEVDAALTRLRDAGFLYEASFYPELTHTFVHALMRDVAYTGLLQESRRLLHERALSGIESLYAERLSEHVERLAQHALAAGDWRKAVRYFREAGTRAAARSAYEASVVHYTHAFSALSHLPQTTDVQSLVIDLTFERRNALYPLGRIEEDREHLVAIMPLAENLGDERRLAWFLAYLARDTSLLGDPARALELSRRARGLAERLGDRTLWTVTTAYVAAAHHARGEYAQAVDLFRNAIAAVGAAAHHEYMGLPGPAGVFFRIWLVSALVRLGQFAEAQRVAVESLDIAASADHPLSLAVGYYSAGVLALFEFDLPRATAALERALQICRRSDLRAWFPNIASHLGLTYARSGRVDDGVELLRQAVSRVSSPYDASSEYAMLAEALLVAGHSDEASEYGRRSLALARAHQERGNEAWALWVLGEIAARRPDGSATAIDHYRQALDLASELGMRPLMAQCYASLARAWRVAEQPAAAAESLAAASSLCRTLGISGDMTEP